MSDQAIYLCQDIVDNAELIAEYETHVTITISKEIWERIKEEAK